MEHQVNLIHIEAIKVKEHVLSVHDICEELECVILFTIVKQYTSSHIAHSLYIAEVRPK